MEVILPLFLSSMGVHVTLTCFSTWVSGSKLVFMVNKLLPQKLQNLVSWSVSLLGAALREELGDEVFYEIESTRKEMKAIRGASFDKSLKALKKTRARYAKKSTQDLKAIAHSYSLMLELINACEIAYRTFRVQEHGTKNFTKRPYGITYVLTAHPTEARRPEILQLFSRIQELLLLALEEGQSAVTERLFHLLRLGVLIPMARSDSPTVRDEAENIFSTVLKPSILDELTTLKKKGVPVYFRAWVGGDKDGHPGVNEKTMVESLQVSRLSLQSYINEKLERVAHNLNLVGKEDRKLTAIKKQTQSLIEKLVELAQIKPGDGRRIKAFHRSLDQLYEKYQERFNAVHPDLDDVVNFLWIFPALVVPLEIREDSEEVKKALKKQQMPIAKMLKTLKAVSQGFEPRWYVRGFVLSMVQGADDIIAGLSLSNKLLGPYAIPVVPLFENENALVNSLNILQETFKRQPKLLSNHKEKLNGRYEIMLGYSDSSKENGVFTSRYLISKTLKQVDRYFSSLGLTPVFFHGSGGSVERGGGSVREQTSWWPKSAVNIFKATVQGEMVARTFANSHLMARQVEIISSQLQEPRAQAPSARSESALQDFSQRVRRHYSVKINDPEFLRVIELATPYTFLQHLRIGSRPTKRVTGLGPMSLRAIPWILCWTQTRTLFPTWWGVGSSFDELNDSEKWKLKEAYHESPLMRSFVKVLAFTLSKVELPIFSLYLHDSVLDPKEIKERTREFVREYKLACDFVYAITGEKDLLWYRPWLEQSIHFRSTMIHPLNIIQLESLRRNDAALLRETVTGIACGMMTTG
jgi:phosphoenolpyruvate carboxylase